MRCELSSKEFIWLEFDQIFCIILGLNAYYIKSWRRCNTPSFDLDVFEQNYVNDVNMILWIPSVELKVNARLVNG